MENVIMGTILLLISISMILGAILTAPKLERIGIRHSARYSFASVCILTGIYLGWVATLFFQDVLGPANYTIELWFIRVFLLISCLHYLWAIWHCDP
jgi:hypothetical protein